jgi:hypothetical protein
VPGFDSAAFSVAWKPVDKEYNDDLLELQAYANISILRLHKDTRDWTMKTPIRITEAQMHSSHPLRGHQRRSQISGPNCPLGAHFLLVNT